MLNCVNKCELAIMYVELQSSSNTLNILMIAFLAHINSLCTFSTESHTMSGKKAHVVAEQPEEPAFLRRIKQQIGYKEPAKNIADKVRTTFMILSNT